MWPAAHNGRAVTSVNDQHGGRADERPGAAGGRVLLVDDEPELLRATGRLLRRMGFEVDTAADGAAALAALQAASYDVVVSDISMPELDGIEMLRIVHERDAELPVIMVTGAPGVETAMQALEYRAFKYLLKPVDVEKLESAVRRAVGLRRMAQVRRQAAALGSAEAPTDDLDMRFESALEALWVAYQPVVRHDGRLVGYEALLRTREASLAHPRAFLDAAEALGRLERLGRTVRERSATLFAVRPEAGVLFLNLHPAELLDAELLGATTALTRIATRVVLEVSERANLPPVHEVKKVVEGLRGAGFRLAVDDVGGGYGGFASFSVLEPDIVKIDTTLVRGIDRLPEKRRMVEAIGNLCAEMGIIVVAEGVETTAERDTLVELGCGLFQGYLIGRPAEAFPRHFW